MKSFNLFLKRGFDIVFSFLGLIITLPLWLIISALIYLEDKGPVFYLQERVGENGRIFKSWKFRSMIPKAEDRLGPVQAKKKDARITRIGKILRATALDELPQLINILKGDMSFVGPRPERPYFVAQLTREIPNFNERLTVKPGLTGLAQVYAKYNTSWKDKLEYDLEYINKINVFLDLKLIFLSLLITLRAGWMKFENT